MQLPDAIDKIRPSVVQIVTNSGRRLGTGFVATDANHVVTAFHVVKDLDKTGESITIGFAGPDLDRPQIRTRAIFELAAGTLVGTDPELDLAVIAVPEGAKGPTVRIDDEVIASPPRPARLKTDKIRPGTQLAVSGYPLAEVSLVTNAGILASHYTPGQPPAVFHECYLGDFTANAGNSGGPVYSTSDAAVIGVCVRGRTAPVRKDPPDSENPAYYLAGLTVIVPAIDVLKLLAEHGLRPAQSPPARQPARGKRRR